uniref:Uncharacterized protein n=1 Tax=Arundo donax TaxID=35708 RepID=A0A0A9CB58_ARUDO
MRMLLAVLISFYKKGCSLLTLGWHFASLVQICFSVHPVEVGPS